MAYNAYTFSCDANWLTKNSWLVSDTGGTEAHEGQRLSGKINQSSYKNSKQFYLREDLP